MGNNFCNKKFSDFTKFFPLLPREDQGEFIKNEIRKTTIFCLYQFMLKSDVQDELSVNTNKTITTNNNNIKPCAEFSV